MVAPRNPAIEINRVQHGGLGDLEIALFAQFPLERRHHRLPLFDAAARQMPPRDIRVFHQEDAAFPVENESPHAERKPARKTPISVEKPPDSGLKWAAERGKSHSCNPCSRQYLETF